MKKFSFYCLSVMVAYSVLMPCNTFAWSPIDIETALVVNAPKVNAKYMPALLRLYSETGFQPIWTSKEKLSNLLVLQDDIAKCRSIGLNDNDYFFDYILGFTARKLFLPNNTDSTNLDIKISEAAIHFYSDVRYGNERPTLQYEGVKLEPDIYYIGEVLAMHVADGTVYQMADAMSPINEQVCAVGESLKWIDYMLNRPYFEEVSISSLKTANNRNLTTKLQQLGLLQGINQPSDSLLETALQTARGIFNLSRQVVYKSELLKQLNVPLEYRYKQLCKSLNYYKWIHALSLTQHAIVVNTASQKMQVFYKGRNILGMKMILGKKSTPTPTFSSQIKNIIFFPYWHVPTSIALHEILPALQRNKNYLAASEIEVLNRNGRTINPLSINWQNISGKNLVYNFRQKNGYYNSLGIVKVDFYSPYGVYLHDTPGKALFLLDYRLFSHGCMRMENPLILARVLLSKHTDFVDSVGNTLPINIQEPIALVTDEKAAIIVWNNNAEADNDMKVVYYKNAYNPINKNRKNAAGLPIPY